MIDANDNRKKIVTDYWIKKLQKKNILSGNGISVDYHVETTTIKNSESDFFKVSNKNELSEFSILTSVFSYLLKRFHFPANDIIAIPYIKSKYSQNYYSKILYLDLSISHEQIFKKYIFSVKDEIEETIKHCNLDSITLENEFRNKGIDELAYQGYCFSYDRVMFKEPCFEHFNIWLEIKNKGDSALQIYLHYNTELHHNEFIKQFLESYVLILNKIKFYINQDIKTYGILGPKTEEKLLKEFKNEKIITDYSVVLDAFHEIVNKFPGKTAIFHQNEVITYSELDKKSNIIANYLIKEHETMKNKVVGIMLDKSIEMIVTVLGVFKSGAAYLPIDPEYPEERKYYLLKNSSIKLLFSNKTNFKFDGTLLKPGKIINDNKTDHKNVAVLQQPSDLAYVIYTSGSTGEPKGVMIEHGSLYNIVSDHIDRFSITENDTIFQFVSFAFDVSLTDFFMALCSGAGLVLPGKNLIDNTDMFLEYLKEKNVTVVGIPPAFINELDLDKLKFLRVLLTGGENSNSKKISYLSKFMDVFNLYGPTECTITSTSYKVEEYDEESQSIPIGKPSRNADVYILDQEQQLVPIGVQGEIYIGGMGVGRGYVANDTATKERFLKNPYADGIFYKTGDLGKYRPDGNIEFLGRVDRQVKIRGFRVELNEIEKHIKHYPSVQDVAVSTIAENETKLLTAYYVAADKTSLTNLKEYLQKFLPQYMIPSYFIALQELPKTGNGKVDYKKLEELDSGLDGRNIVEPGNDLERRLLEIWKDVLGKGSIGVENNFFELGGHSLKAARMISIYQRDFNKTLTINEVFENPTIKKLAELIKKKDRVVYSEISALPKQDFYDLSHSQRRLWVLSQFEETGYAYNIPGAFLLRNLNKEAFLNALKELVKRHEILRTNFIKIKGQPKQKITIYEGFNFQVKQVDISSKKENEGILKKLIDDEIKVVFDVEKDPLIRVTLIKTTNQDYVFLFTIHHIIADGKSMEILFQELMILYNTNIANEKSPLEQLKIHYKDYTAWQNKRLSENHLNDSEKYWLEKLNGELPVLNLPLDYKRPKAQNFSGKLYTFLIGMNELAQLKNLAGKNDSTLYMLGFAILNIIIYKYTGQKDFIIGTPVSGRDHPLLEGQIGLYMNTLAIRNKIDENERFCEYLKRIKNELSEALKHKEFPFDQLIDDLNVKRDLSRSPVFDIMYTYTNELGEYEENNFDLSPMATETTASKFDLDFSFSEFHEGLKINIVFNDTLFKYSSIERMSFHFKKLIDQIINSDGELKISNLDILTNTEKSELLLDFNERISGDEKIKTVIKLFEEQVKKEPDSTAVVYNERKISYRELNKSVNQLASYLLEVYDVKPNEFIGIMAKRSDKMLISILAILKVGCAYIPIDKDYPEERISFVINDSGLNFIIVDDFDKEKKLKPIYKGNIIIIPEIEKKLDKYPVKFSFKKQSLNNLAYIIYTSGSTGKPKGVMIENKSLASLIFNLQSNFYLKAGGKIASFTNYTFDISLLELVCSLCIGMEVYILAVDNIDSDLKVISSEKIDHIQLTPSRLLQLYDANNRDLSFLENVKTLLLGGEAFPVSLCDSLLKLKNLKVINVYGPTETTIWSTSTLIEANSEITIGKPLENEKIYILNESKQLVPKGVSGEICISGYGLARGYLNRESLTKQRFIENPYSDSDYDKRLYLTGDLGKYSEDGRVIFLGRKDDQIKVRGYRIELAEIEKTIKLYETVEDAVVIVKGKEEKELIAYLKASSSEIKLSEMRKFLQLKLPVYMIPDQFVQLDKFPLTFNGKVDKLQLISETGRSIATGKKHVKAKTELERSLVKIWQEVLGQKKVSVEDNFFELGGHSLKGIRLISILNETFKKALKINDLFLNPTIREQARTIEGRVDYENNSVLTLTGEEFYDISPAQRRIWLINQIQGQSPEYNIPHVLQFEENINEDILKQALEFIANEQEILKARFVEVNGDIKQTFEDTVTVDFETVYLDSEEELNSKTKLYLKEASNYYFDLESGPLFGLALLKFKNKKTVIISVIHHIIADGIAVNLFHDRLSILYKNIKENIRVEKADLKFQYKDYAAWQLENINDTDKKYWLETLKGELEPLSLPYDRDNQENLSSKASSFSFYLNEKLSKSLNELALDNHATLFMVLLSSFKIILSRISGQKDILIGLPVSGRNINGTESLIGCFINTVILRSFVSEAISFNDFLKEVKKSTLSALEHQNYPFEELVNHLDLKRDINRYPVSSVYFNMLNFHEKNEVKKKLENYIHEKPDIHTKFDLNCYVYETKDNIHFNVVYKSSLFNKETIETIFRRYESFLEHLILDAEKNICLIGRKEIKLANEGKNKKRFPANVVKAFETVAKKYSTNVAVKIGNKSISYLELNYSVNKWARYLSEDDCKYIAIAVGHNDTMIRAILSVLKAGKAYVAIDINHPGERINSILNGVELRTILVDDDSKDLLKTSTDRNYNLVNINENKVVEKFSSENPSNQNLSGDNEAYVLFTSGSTGRAKGIVQSHRSILYYVDEYSRFINIDHRDRLSGFFSYAYDSSVLDIFAALLNGATYLPKSLKYEATFQEISDYLQSEKISIWHSSPTLFRLFCKETKSCVYNDLRYVKMAGETVLSNDFNLFKAITNSNAEFIVSYGSSESTLVSIKAFNHNDSYELKKMSSGLPISMTDVVIMNEDGFYCDTMELGEILVGSEFLAKGYQEELKLIDLPFYKIDGKNFYRSGDIGKYLLNGEILVLGREDKQIKVRGNRVELSEIDNILLESGIIKQSVSIALKIETEVEAIISYIVADQDIDIETIRLFLSKKIPDYMLPQHVIILNELPLTNSGKVDEKLLPKPELSEFRKEFLLPETELEEKILKIWLEVMEKEKISVIDNFFELGGHSLKANQIASRISKELNLDFSLKMFFTKPTIREMAEELNKDYTIRNMATENTIVDGDELII